MNDNSFQMFIATLLLATPSSLNQLIANSQSTIQDFVQNMQQSNFHVDAINRAQTDLFPNIDKAISQPLLTALQAQTTLHGIFSVLGVIIHDQLAGLYGGSTIHPAPNEVMRLVSAARLLDGLS